jgi:tRNA(adenine34) deaminase
MFTSQDECWMHQALQFAEMARQKNEVPVGAVLVHDGRAIGEGYNCPIAANDPTAHAEIIALRAGAEKISNYRLINSTLYVTLEPCLMCAGAIIHARIKRLIYGASDPRVGAISSQLQALDQRFLNHRVEHLGGLLAKQCGCLLSQFFKKRRGG